MSFLDPDIFGVVISVYNCFTVISAFFLRPGITVQNYNTWHAPGVSVCMLAPHAPRAMGGHMWRLLDRPASRQRKAAAPPAGKHVNFVKGMHMAMRCGAQGTHAAVNTLRAQKLRVTAPNLAQLSEFHELPQFTVNFSRLRKELKEYWTRNGLNSRNCPDDVELQVGSRVKLWAHEMHADIGFAYAHPSLDGKPRFARPR